MPPHQTVIMSVDPNEYDVGELRAIAGVDGDTGDAAESDSGTSDAVDATPASGAQASEDSDAVDAGTQGGVDADTADTVEDETGESAPWEAVPSAEDADPWVSVPDADDEQVSDDDPDETTTEETDPVGESDTATDETVGASSTTTADADTDTHRETTAATVDEEQDPATDADEEPDPAADGAGSDTDDGDSNPFTVDLGPAEPAETDEPDGDAAEDTPDGNDEQGTSDTGTARADDTREPDTAGETATGDAPDADTTTTEERETMTVEEDPLSALIHGGDDGDTDALEGNEPSAAVPDSPPTPDRIEGPSGEPGTETQAEIAEALNATTRGGTKRITRAEPTGPGPGDESASPEDTLPGGVPADEQVTVDGSDLPDDDPSSGEEWSVETSTEAVEALYSGPGDETEPLAESEGGEGVDDEAETEGALSGAREIDFGFEESGEDTAGRRLSEQVADVLYAGEDPPE